MSRALRTRIIIAVGSVGLVLALGGVVWAVTSGLRANGMKSGADENIGRGRQKNTRLTTVEGAFGDEAVITLAGPARTRAGIVTSVLGTASRAGGIQLAGELVADPGRTTTVQAPVPGRLVAVGGGHWPALGERVEAGAVLGQISDAKPLIAPRGGTVMRIGAQPGEVVQPGQELLELTDFAEPLARIVWRADAPLPPPKTLMLAPLLAPLTHARRQANDLAVRARLVGATPGVDSLTRYPVYLYRATRPWPGAGSGTPVTATMAGAGQSASGVLVPTAAAVQWQGLLWVYVERPVEPGAPQNQSQYVRARLDASRPVDGGWLLTDSGELPRLQAGDRVVVRGAQQLLSEEFRSRAVVGEGDPNGGR